MADDRKPGFYVDCPEFKGRTRWSTRNTAERSLTDIETAGKCRERHEITEVT